MNNFIVLYADGKEVAAFRKESIDAFFIDATSPNVFQIWVRGRVYQVNFFTKEECEEMFQNFKKELSNQ